MPKLECIGDDGWTVVTDAYLDSGAYHNFISLHLFDKIHGSESRNMSKDTESAVSSANGTSIETIGTTKFQFRWYDHHKKQQTKRMEFRVVEDLYPPMIFGVRTIAALELLKVADTWPEQDSKRGLFMFNRPWKNKKKQAEEAAAVRNIERENAIAARQEIAQQERERNSHRHTDSSREPGSRPQDTNGSSARSDVRRTSASGPESRHSDPSRESGSRSEDTSTSSARSNAARSSASRHGSRQT